MREILDAFEPLPDAWTDAPCGLETVIRLERKHEPSARPNSDELLFYPDRVLADLRRVDMEHLDVWTVMNDCLLLADAIHRNPGKVCRVLRMARDATSRREIDAAYGIMKELYLTDEPEERSGGGMLWLTIAVLLFASCEHCHVSHEIHAEHARANEALD
jgi:hypothetical protein